MWMLLLSLLLFIQGVSFADDCSGRKNITVSPGGTFMLDINEDGVQGNTLLLGDGTDLARIEEGNLTIVDGRYEGNLTAKGFSFLIKNTDIKGEKNFSASVLYTNGRLCSQHYTVTVRGGEICSEIKEIRYRRGTYFTLDFGAPDVEKIAWSFRNRTIAITKDTAQLQILHRDYEGSLSVIDVSLRKHDAAKEDVGDYTARVTFRNGTRCQQHYSVTIHGFQWLVDFFIPGIIICTALVTVVFVVLVGLIRRCWLKSTRQAKERTQRLPVVNTDKENFCNFELQENSPKIEQIHVTKKTT